MLTHPVKFVCPSCGLDASEFVNDLIRREFGAQTLPEPGAPTAPPPPPPPFANARLRVALEAPPATPPPASPAPSKYCGRHRERATGQCSICHKPICPKCMELFGFFCSPLCKGKAEAQHIEVPVYAGRKDLVEARFWRRTGLVAGIIGLVVLLFLGAWGWYEFYGSKPHPCLSVRFADSDRGYYGRAQLVGQDQVVFLHGGTLARYDLKTKQPVWSQELITKQQVDDGVKLANEEQAKLNEGTGYQKHLTQDTIERTVKQALHSELILRVSGQNVWVGRGDRLTHYNWDTGKVVRDLTLPERAGELVESGGELLMIGAQTVTHISLVSGDAQIEQFGPAGAKTVSLAQNDASGGLPGAGAGKLDPRKVEAQAQNLNLPARIALPALLSNARHEQQLEQALKDDPLHPGRNGATALPVGAELFRMVPGPTGCAQFSWRMLEPHLITRSAMKAAPKKSALDGDVNVGQTTEVANELLNEMQRNAGGDTVTEDESRYQVTVHLPGAAGTADWTGEVVGPPQLFVLKTVNVLAGGKSVVVLDKSNQKLWQASLTYPVSNGGGAFSRLASPYGEGPCVERGHTLYVFDQAVLTAFELASGNARWRLPSVGILGLFFDDQDHVYVNTTTGNPDDLKYARQIDISRSTQAVVSKLEPKTGKTLWTIQPGGYISYLSGQFIYVIEAYDPNPTDADDLNDMTTVLQKPAYLRISRLRPSDGRILWDYYDPLDRCPVNWSFDGNSIQLIFRREVQVLRYLAL